LTPPGPVKPYAPPKDYRPEPPPGYAAVQPNPAGYARKSADVAAATATVVAGVGKHISTIANGAAGQAKAAYNANKAAAAPPALAAVPAPPPASRLDRSTRLSALQSSLTDAISKGAALTAPQRFTANQPADVSLTIPAAFADTLRNEAQKNGLSDAAASVNMNVVLSGDGFSVTPDETQSLPLTVGQPTEFRWTVTAQPGAKGPLHADVGADLLGGGSDTLALGSVQKQAGFGVKPTPRMVGAAILVLILARTRPEPPGFGAPGLARCARRSSARHGGDGRLRFNRRTIHSVAVDSGPCERVPGRKRRCANRSAWRPSFCLCRTSGEVDHYGSVLSRSQPELASGGLVGFYLEGVKLAEERSASC
jgi:hypothetical protein